MNLLVPCSSIIMLAISLANLRMRTVSQDGAFPPCSGRFTVPVLYMELSWFDIRLWIYGLVTWNWRFWAFVPSSASFGGFCFLRFV